MSAPARRLHYFFFGQNFADGLRTTVAILLPALLGAQWGQLEAGITVSTGAVCVGLADAPGPVQHRRTAMLAALGLVGAVGLLTAAVGPHPWALGVEIGALSFGLTMLLVWGARAGAVGTGALLAMVLTLAHPLAPADVLPHAGLLALGGAWYLLLALAVQQVRPYWPAQQALGECLHAVAHFTEIKAPVFEPGTDLEATYPRLVAQQVVVNERQEAVRDVLFRTRQIVTESTPTGRRLVLAFSETVDLYERLAATYVDYAALQTSFATAGILPAVAAYLRRVAAELDRLGAAVQVNRTPAPLADLTGSLTDLQARIAALDPALGLVRGLRKILVNLRAIGSHLPRLWQYFGADDQAAPAPGRVAEHRQFVVSQAIEWRAWPQNLTLRSSVFRHALRMMLACLAAYTLAQTLWQGRHSYWILMTVTFMLKPTFSLTRERNLARIRGTLAGAALGVAVLIFVPWSEVRLALLVGFMVAAYSFQRTHYWVTVIFTTAYLLILFSFLGLSYIGVIQERVIDTLAGCALAFGAGYFLFPSWESDQLRDLLAATLRANLAYLRQLAAWLAGVPDPPVVRRLRRKAVFVASANLAAAFQRMLTEPKSKQHRPAETHRFVVLNHVLAANLAALAATLDEGPPAPLSTAGRRALLRAQAALTRALARLAPAAPEEPAPLLPAAADGPDPLREQLAFLQKVSSDIGRAAEELAG